MAVYMDIQTVLPTMRTDVQSKLQPCILVTLAKIITVMESRVPGTYNICIKKSRY